MSYLTRKAYRIDKAVLYNNCNTNSLYGQIVPASEVGKIGDDSKIFEGSIWTNKGILARANLISPYTAGGNTLIPHNPYPFKVGDVLYEIGDATEDLMGESQRINGATAQTLGTITAIDSAKNYQVTEVTPSAIAVGDVFTLDLEGQTASFTATTTNVADVTKGLKDALLGGLRSHHSLIDCLDITEDGTKLVFTAKEPGEIFTIKGSVVGAGQLAIAVTTSVGAITITPDPGNNSHEVGAKIGRIDQYPLGVIAKSYYLTDNEGLEKTVDIAAYDTANVYRNSIHYLDGQIVTSLPTIKFFPNYGQV